MAIREHAEGKRDLLLIDPRKLTVDPQYNVRQLDAPEEREDLDELKSLIRASGVQEALRVREDETGSLVIVRGHRRHKVVMELIAEAHDIKLVPVTQEPRGTTPADRNWDLIDSNSAAPLKLIERAEVLYRQIHVFGWTEEDILRRTGKTKQWLNQQLDLRAMPEPMKEHVRQGDISATLAKQISKNADPEKAAELIRANLEENKKVAKGTTRRTKVTRKTLERDKPKASAAPTVYEPKPPVTTFTQPEPSALAATSNSESQPQAKTFSPLSDEKPPHHEPHEQLQTAVARENGKPPAPVREFSAAAFEKPRDGVEGLLLKFLNADILALALMYRNLCREQEEAAVNGGATQAQYQLPVAADVIGVLRFPDEWAQAKANSELAEVA